MKTIICFLLFCFQIVFIEFFAGREYGVCWWFIDVSRAWHLFKISWIPCGKPVLTGLFRREWGWWLFEKFDKIVSNGYFGCKCLLILLDGIVLSFGPFWVLLFDVHAADVSILASWYREQGKYDAPGVIIC